VEAMKTIIEVIKEIDSLNGNSVMSQTYGLSGTCLKIMNKTTVLSRKFRVAPNLLVNLKSLQIYR
jgi:hypothetical protein